MDEDRASREELRAEIQRLRRSLETLEKREAELQAELQTAEDHARETQRELRQVQRQAETAARAKSEFLANMSHEIRTPMTAIVGFTDLILDGGDLSRIPPERLEALQTIKRSSRHLVRILDDILDLSKIEAGRLETERIPVAVQDVVADVAAVMGPAAGAKRIGFDVSYAGPLPARIQTDPTRLRQILMNLLGNAIKFTDQGGVRLVIQLVDSELGRPRLLFSVSDTGVGISPAGLDKIFGAFSQADDSTTRRFGGTGLGLAICKRLASVLGGDITARSIENQGSTFDLTIDPGPLQQVTVVEDDDPTTPGSMRDLPSPVATAAEVGDLLSDAQILLVEDGEDNRRLITHILRRAGFTVAHAVNGAVGLQHALSASEGGAPFDLIVMDMQMPVLDGYEATRRMREAGIEEPIIALTAHAMKGDRERCLEAGCDEFATKPLKPREFVRTVVEHITRHRAVQAARPGKART